MVNIPQIKTPSRGSFKLKRYHGYQVLLFIFGTIFPPLAVAARFGIGSDFFLNLVLTLCGYIPGHVHNFYIQNIRNNKNNRRTPKWAIRYGLVSDEHIKKSKRKSAWANRYEERLPQSTYEGREVEDGQVPDPASRPDSMGSTGSTGNGAAVRRSDSRGNTLWREDDESFYSNTEETTTTGRWHYPANFEDTEIVPDVSRKRKKKKSTRSKRDRWERSEDAYAAAAAPPKKRKSTRRRSGSEGADGPEDPLGAHYGRAGDGERQRSDSLGENGGSFGESEMNGAAVGATQRDPLAHDF
ncbi:hypothetical protein DACRYDRAFT_81060 [Dacryopinax primogenitus]|uniref:Uncharacterized protein n=1 Tax=Dacryopinax primogenitus (strain DJM 731) TaxID=1858805 RepID=M5GAB5_DACPD|nr:uncharacterized protein DACRYDRAFT_81060 [Dacryopinax primogenitus]EJU00838.1 hypothetical protein DACRYDRAFT_81060 [Dacryopinax primogenitus]